MPYTEIRKNLGSNVVSNRRRINGALHLSEIATQLCFSNSQTDHILARPLFKGLFGQRQPEEIEEIQNHILDLAAIEPGWDRPHTPAPDKTAISRLLAVTSCILRPEGHAYIPSWVPLRAGGVDAKWPRGSESYSITVEPNGIVYEYTLGQEDDADHLDQHFDTITDAQLDGARTRLIQFFE